MELYRVELKKYKGDYYNEFTWRDGKLELVQMLFEIWNETDELLVYIIKAVEKAFEDFRQDKKSYVYEVD